MAGSHLSGDSPLSSLDDLSFDDFLFKTLSLLFSAAFTWLVRRKQPRIARRNVFIVG